MYESDLWIDFYFPLFQSTENLSLDNIKFIGESYRNNFLGNLGYVCNSRIHVDYTKIPPYLELYFFHIVQSGKKPSEILDLALSERYRVSHVLTVSTGELLKQTHVKPIHRQLYKHSSEIEFIPKNTCLPQGELIILSEKFNDIVFLNQQTKLSITK